MRIVHSVSMNHRFRLPETFACVAIFGLLLFAGAREARAQDSAAVPAVEERPTGLPKGVHWTFNFDAGIGAFGFANSLYTDVKPDPSGDLSDDWAETYVKPALSGWIGLGKSQMYVGISAVGERTFGAPPPLVGTEAASFGPEDLYIGWRSGTSIGSSDNFLDLSVGREVYKIGHGMLLWDGAVEGGSRGGFWSNARKAWAFAGIAKVHPKIHTFEAFYLDRSQIPGSDENPRVWGFNYEIAPTEHTTLGATYLQTLSDSNAARDGQNVYNVRAYTAPFSGLRDLSFEAEFAAEDNGDLRSSTAWTAQVGYQFSKAGWAPKVSYRYAFFEGDNPSTAADESFDPLFPGFYDWGTWWQGEIAGEYFLANSNLISNQIRLSLTPSEAVSAGLIGYYFQLDQLPPGVTSKDLVGEVDAYVDWQANSNFIISFVAAFANPGGAIEQAFGRTENFTYGMVYVAYAY
jgi:hypothetical protein